MTQVGTSLTAVANVGLTFPGNDLEYLKGLATLLVPASTGNAGTLVVRAFPTGFNAGQKNYLVLSGASSKFLDVYCDGSNGNELRVDWYPSGVETTKTTGVTCPSDKWFLVGVAINNEGRDANIKVEVRLQDSATWETVALSTETQKTLQYTDTGDILIGSKFIGTIHSVEFLTTNGDLSLSQAALNSNYQIIILILLSLRWLMPEPLSPGLSLLLH